MGRQATSTGADWRLPGEPFCVPSRGRGTTRTGLLLIPSKTLPQPHLLNPHERHVWQPSTISRLLPHSGQAGPELLEQARAILEEYGVGGWAGFSGHDPNVLDGSSFRLEATLADGTRIEAHGENKFPPNYRDVMSALDALTAAAQKNALQQYTP